MVVKAIHISIKAPNTFAKAIKGFEFIVIVSAIRISYNPFIKSAANIKDGIIALIANVP